MNLDPIAEEITAAILSGRSDERIIRYSDSKVRIKISDIIPDGGAKQTTEGRRKRLRSKLEQLLGPHGWKRRHGTNTFIREGHNGA